MNENYYHQHQNVRTENGIQYGDLVEFMDFEYLRKNTAMNLSNLANLGQSAFHATGSKSGSKKVDQLYLSQLESSLKQEK
jgi:hypothetical protein